MNPLCFSLNASNPAVLLTQLTRVDISIPDIGSRTTRQREQYLAARFLAALAKTNELSFPLRIEHQDKPDFILHLSQRTTGIECIEAVEPEWAEIRKMRDRYSPEAIVSIPMLKADQKTLTYKERELVAKGETDAPPWIGNAAELQWAETLAHYISQKTAKLRNGNYSDFKENWLLIQDECSVPPLSKVERIKAFGLCARRIQNSLVAPSFARIFIASGSWLVHIDATPIAIHPIPRIW